MNREQKQQALKKLFWDYNIDTEQYLDILETTRPGLGEWVSREKIILRMLERLNWYTLVEFFGMEELKNTVSSDRWYRSQQTLF